MPKSSNISKHAFRRPRAPLSFRNATTPELAVLDKRLSEKLREMQHSLFCCATKVTDEQNKQQHAIRAYKTAVRVETVFQTVLKTPNVGSPTVNNVGPLSKTNFCEKEALKSE